MKAEMTSDVDMKIYDEDDFWLGDASMGSPSLAADLRRRINGFDVLKAACELVVSAFSEPDWGVDGMIVDKVRAALADAGK